MTDLSYDRLMRTLAEVISAHQWDRLTEVFHDDAVLEYPQSGEVFRGVRNIRGQFEDYPGLESGTSQLQEVVGDTTYALTATYTVIAVEGSGRHSTAVIRIRYPDGSWWWALNLNEIRDGRVARSRSYFAPDFEPPDWRAPYREAPAR
jgi:ketosteroid isomerase-like protein